MTKVVPSGAAEAVPQGEFVSLDPATVKWSDRPVPEDGGVTHVSVELIVQDFKVDTHNGEFLQATFDIVLEWTDPRILAAGIDTSDQSAVPKDIWRPAACFPTNYEWADPQRPVTFISLAPGRLMWWRSTKPTRVDISSAGGSELCGNQNFTAPARRRGGAGSSPLDGTDLHTGGEERDPQQAHVARAPRRPRRNFR